MPAIIKWELQGLRDTHGRFARFSQQLREDVRQEAKDEAKEYLAIIKSEAPSRTGRLRKGLTFQSKHEGFGIAITFSSAAPVLTYVLRGTRPHMIFPKQKRALAFFWEKMGQQVVLHHVNHPGTKKNDFILRAREKADPRFADQMRKRVVRLTQTVFKQ